MKSHLVGQSPSLLTEDGEAILLITRDVELPCDVLRRFTHRVRMMELGEGRIRESPADRGVVDFGNPVEGGRALGHDEWSAAHALDTAGDEHVPMARFDHSCRYVDGFKAGSAKSVHGAPRNSLWQTCQKGGHSGDVAIVLACLVRGSEIDLVDRRGIDSSLRDGLANGDGGQIVGTHGGKTAAVAAKVSNG